MKKFLTLIKKLNPHIVITCFILISIAVMNRFSDGDGEEMIV